MMYKTEEKPAHPPRAPWLYRANNSKNRLLVRKISSSNSRVFQQGAAPLSVFFNAAARHSALNCRCSAAPPATRAGKGKNRDTRFGVGRSLKLKCQQRQDVLCSTGISHWSKQDSALLSGCMTAGIISFMNKSWCFSFFLYLIKKLQSL